MAGFEGSGSDSVDPMRAAYDFAWQGFKQTELDTTDDFLSNVDAFPVVVVDAHVNQLQTRVEPKVATEQDGYRITTQESLITYAPVDVTELDDNPATAHLRTPGKGIGIVLARYCVEATTDSLTDDTDHVCTLATQDVATLVHIDRTTVPPTILSELEQIVRPEVLTTVDDDVEPDAATDVIHRDFTDPMRPPTYQDLLKQIERQHVYRGLIGAVGVVRNIRL